MANTPPSSYEWILGITSEAEMEGHTTTPRNRESPAISNRLLMGHRQFRRHPTNTQHHHHQQQPLQEKQNKISMASSPLQHLAKASKILATKNKKATKGIQKKAPRRPKPETDAELRKTLSELQKLSRAQVRAAKVVNSQVGVLLEKAAKLEAATENLEAALAAKRKININKRKAS